MSVESKPANMEELRELVVNHEGVLTRTMETLRDAYGKGRLGVHVRAGIQDALADLGLGHYPDPLPEYQNLLVRLYRKGSPVGKLIQAVLDLDDPDGDESIRRSVGGNEAEILRQIRELVCP